MSKSLIGAILAFGLLVVSVPASRAQDDNVIKGSGSVIGVYRDELTDKIELAIKKGCLYLRNTQSADGSWCPPDQWRDHEIPGATGVILMGMLYSGVDPKLPTIKRGLEYLAKHGEVDLSYSRGAVLCAFALADPQARDRRFKKVIRGHAAWFLKVQGQNKDDLWHYKASQKDHDMSTVQFSLEGLRMADAYGINLPDKAMVKARDALHRFQMPDGGWAYRPVGHGGTPVTKGKNTMTAATAAGLAFLDAFRAKHTEKDGITPMDPRLVKGLEALEKHYSATSQQYFAYSIERAGILTGHRFIKGKDWYRDIAKAMISRQKDDGSFHPYRGNRSIAFSTGFTLLFLGKGLAPIIVGKLDFGEESRAVAWDMRNLTDHVAREMGTHLNWMWLPIDAKLDHYKMVPMIYISSTGDPYDKLVKHRDKLKQYIEMGGTLLGSGIGRKTDAFDDGFRKFVKEISGLEPTDVDRRHSFFRRHHRVSAARAMEAAFPKDSERPVAILMTRPFASALASTRGRYTRTAQFLGTNIIVSLTQIDKRESFVNEVMRTGKID